MSKTVDERVVEMRFDNSQFESNVKTTMSTLDRLKAALKFPSKTDALSSVAEGAKNATNGIGNVNTSVSKLQASFSALQVIGVTALANITNTAIDAGKRIVGALTLDPLKSGYSEYETQINAIQTILANTSSKGTTLDQVNEALDTLNTYADKTIYNFTEMTRNIGTFTAAGVDLQTSVDAIQGIANLAAVSGSTSAQASSAMYQLSQALAAGRVSLQDWNSVVYAGMGGEVFQKALIRTSEVMGTGAEEAIKKYGSFRDSLSRGQWLTTDVLTETLKQFTMAAEEGSEQWNQFKQSLMDQGYTEQQAVEILQMANTATDAATKVKTLSQLIGTAGEALGSGWTQSWEIIVGDFEQAQELFTSISDVVTNAINDSATARNELLQGWADLGGRDALIEGLSNAFQALLSIINPIKEAFREIFPPTTAQQLYDLTDKFRNFTKSLILNEESAESLKNVFHTIFSAIKLVGEGISGLITFFLNFAQNASGVISSLGEIASSIGNLIDSFIQAVEEGTAFQQIMENVGAFFGSLTSGVSEFLASGFSKIGEIFNSITPEQINTVLNAIATGGFVGTLKAITDQLSNFGGVGKGVVDELVGAFSEFTGGFGDAVVGVLNSVRDALVTWQQNIKSTILLKIAVAVALLASSAGKLASLDPQSLRDALGAITVLFGELMLTMSTFSKIASGASFGTSSALTLISMAMSISVLAGALTDVAGLDTDAITRGVEGIAGLAAVMVAAAKLMGMGGGTVVKGSFNLVVMAGAIKLLASVINDLSGTSIEQIKNGLIGIGGLFAEVAAFSRLAKSSGMAEASLSMIAMGAALKIMTSVIKDFEEINPDTAIEGIAAIGALLAEIGGFSRLVNGNELLKSFIPLLAFGGILVTFSKTISTLSGLDPNGVAVAVGAISALLAEITAMMHLMPDPKKINSIGIALPAMSLSLTIMASAISKLATLNIEQVGVALAGFTTAIVTMFAGIKTVSGNGSSVLVLLLASTALTVLATAIKLISTVGLVGVATSLASLAGTFIILGAAAKLLGPVTPALFKLAGALAAFGGALIAVGVGTAAVGVGFSVSIAAMAAALLSMQQAIIQLNPEQTAITLGVLIAAFVGIGVASKILSPLIPTLLRLSLAVASFGLSCAAVAASIALLVAAFGALSVMGPEAVGSAVEAFKTLLLGILQMIPETAQAIGEAFKSLVLAALDALTTIAPQIAESVLKILTEVLASLTEYGPQIVDFVITFIIQIIDGVAARIPELVSSIGNLLNSLFTSIFDALSGWSANEGAVNAALTVLGGVSGLIVVFNAIKSMIPGAMAGAVGVAAFIAEVGAIIAAFGAIQQIPGVQWLITEGGNLLQSIGTAIGQFIGGFVGGIAEGATATLPQVGTNLSQFMMNLTPFLTGASMITPELGTSVQNLATAILTLTAANVIDSIASFITGGTDWSGFADQLVPFGEAMRDFANTLSGVDMTALSMGAQAGVLLAQMANSMPKEGGLAQAIFGENPDMASFGEELVDFGEAIMDYGGAVKGISEYIPDITASAQAGQALSDLANSLPKEGGLAAAIFGETTSMSDFGDDLVDFGEALISYGQSVAGISDYIEPINQSVQAGQALKDLASSLPKEGGLAAAIFGDNPGLDTFGQQLTDFGQAINDYGSKVTGVDYESITNATSQMSRLLALVKANSDDAENIGNGLENVKKIVDFGDILQQFWNKISEIDFSKIDMLVTNINKLVNVISSMAGLDTSGIAVFQSAIEQLAQTDVSLIEQAFASVDMSSIGISLAQSLANGFSAGSDAVLNSATAMAVAVKALLLIYLVDFRTIGTQYGSNFAEGIASSARDAADAARRLVESASNALNGYKSQFHNAGYNLAIGFANGIDAGAFKSRISAQAMANAAANAARRALDEHSPSKVFYEIGAYAGMGMANALNDYADVCSKAAQNMGDEASDGASMGMRALTAQFDDISLDPTIRPVMDLTDVRNGVDYINSALSGNSTFGILGQASRINRALNSNRQNGTTDDVIRELSRLRSDIQQMPVNQYTVNGITYDDGSAIAGAVGQLIRTTRLERRI